MNLNSKSIHKYKEKININLCQDPVFIVGPARSGTTWIQSILASTPYYYSCPETHFYDTLMSESGLPLGYQRKPKKNYDKEIISKEQLEMSFDLVNVGFLNIDESFKNRMRQISENNALSRALYLDSLIKNCSTFHDKKRKIWVEKTPIHNRYLKEIFSDFPNAKVICMIRNPMDVLRSAKKSLNIPIQISLEDYESSYKSVFKFIHNHPEKKNRILYVHYEEIKENLVSCLKIFEFLGVNNINLIEIMKTYRDKFSEIYKNTPISNIQPQMNSITERQDSCHNLLCLEKYIKSHLTSFSFLERYLITDNYKLSHGRARFLIKYAMYLWKQKTLGLKYNLKIFLSVTLDKLKIKRIVKGVLFLLKEQKIFS